MRCRCIEASRVWWSVTLADEWCDMWIGKVHSWCKSMTVYNHPWMMTSSNGNIFRVTGPLCGEFTGPRWIPAQRPVTRSFDVFFDLRLNKRLSIQSWGWWFETLSCPFWRHCNGDCVDSGDCYQIQRLLPHHHFHVNTLRPRQNGRHFADDIFKCIFLNEDVWIPNKISLKFVPKGPINNNPTLVQVMAWRRPGDKPLSEPMMVRLPTDICVTRPQWVKESSMLARHARSKILSMFYHHQRLICLLKTCVEEIERDILYIDLYKLWRVMSVTKCKLWLLTNVERGPPVFCNPITAVCKSGSPPYIRIGHLLRHVM